MVQKRMMRRAAVPTVLTTAAAAAFAILSTVATGAVLAVSAATGIHTNRGVHPQARRFPLDDVDAFVRPYWQDHAILDAKHAVRIGHGGDGLPLDLQRMLLREAIPVDTDADARSSMHDNDDNYEFLPEFMKSQQQQQKQLQRSLANYDDAFYAYDDAVNYAAQDTDDATSSNSALDAKLTQYAFKYVGCQNIRSWSDDDNAQNDNGDNQYNYDGSSASTPPLKMHRFVMFRLCPSQSCSSYNTYGCNQHYGEYMLPMETYLALLHEYHYTQLQKYCNVCDQCMNYQPPTSAPTASPASSNAGQYYAQNDYMGYNDDGQYGDDYYGGRHRQLDNNNNYYNGYNYKNDDGYFTDDYAKDESSSSYTPPWYIDGDGMCIYSTVCSGYQAACSEYLVDGVADEHSYFACTLIQGVGYAGPHCRSDGRTMEIAMFDDAVCARYKDDQFAHFNNSAILHYSDKTCIACQADHAFGLVTDESLASGSAAESNPLCTALYDGSAKCHAKLQTSSSSRNGDSNSNNDDDAWWSSQYDSSNQRANEAAVCTFIKALEENLYNEKGEIYLQSQYYAITKWAHRSEYGKLAHSVPTGQRVGLVLSLAAAVTLAVYVLYLHRKVYYRGRSPYAYSLDKDGLDNEKAAAVAKTTSQSPSSRSSVSNRPFGSLLQMGSDRIARINSGILAMRSRSGEAAEPYVPYGGAIPSTHNRHVDPLGSTLEGEEEECEAKSTATSTTGASPPPQSSGAKDDTFAWA